MHRLRPFRLTRRRLAALAVLLPLGWFVASLLFVYVLTRRPHARFAQPAPAVSWGTLEEHRLRTRDGETLGAWFLGGPADGPSVLVLHGYRGSRWNSLSAGEFFHVQGCAVLMISLRAHGDSTGEFNDFGYSARHDVVAAVEFLERQRPGRPIVVDGTSLGAAAAVFAGGELTGRVSAYILESPYRDLHQAVRNRLGSFLPPGVDRLAYTGALLAGRFLLPDADRIAPIDHIAAIPPAVPILILSGTKDVRALPAEAQALCDRAGAHAQLVLFDGAGHECLLKANPDQYTAAVVPLLRGLTARRAAEATGRPAESADR